MKKAIIYIPNKNPMQSGLAKNDKWILEFKTKDPTKNPLMGWESSSDTLNELRLEFSTKELAINYAKKMKIDYEIIEPKKNSDPISSNIFFDRSKLNSFFFQLKMNWLFLLLQELYYQLSRWNHKNRLIHQLNA